MTDFKVGELLELHKWLVAQRDAQSFLVSSRPKSTYGYLPKTVNSRMAVQFLFEDWEKINEDGDFDVTTYDGPISVAVS